MSSPDAKRMISPERPTKRQRANAEEDELNEFPEIDDYVPYVPVKQRRQQKISKILSYTSQQKDRDESGDSDREGRTIREFTAGPKANVSLIEQAQEVKKQQGDHPKTELEKQLEAEAEILKAQAAAQKALASDRELAQGIKYTEPMKTSWTPPSTITSLTDEQIGKIREKYRILTDGTGVPPPIPSFRHMRLPEPLVRYLQNKGITTPTPIQMQGLPVALTGRDMIGIAFTGSGKTLAFSIPLLMRALEQEMSLPLVEGEGPVGIIVVPSRELARQIYEGLVAMSAVLCESMQYPELRVMLCMGGIPMSDQINQLRHGVHMVVATPGRLQHMLENRKFGLLNCTYLCLDEADRMVDMGFEDDMRNIMGYFKHQRQTLLFSATMPKKILSFAKNSLVQPIIVNVGRAGAASMNIIQEVEYVPEEFRIIRLLEVLQKTAPPVLVFAENKNDVDDIYEYFLVKGVAAVAIHGSKTQEEREFAIRTFKSRKADVLCATDVASKGLDFADIQHVINFDMPKEIDDYVHRIGRTGRSGKTGVATTFINKSCSEQILLDLKYLLKEAKQRVPPVLEALEDPNEKFKQDGVEGECTFCGGLGHRITDCPKLEAQRKQLLPGRSAASAAKGDY